VDCEIGAAPMRASSLISRPFQETRSILAILSAWPSS
jgi:hypothetical protein